MTDDTSSIGWQQARHRADEVCAALRALLMTPLMTPAHAEFAAVRCHADELRVWFARETGWTLQIERDAARLYKRPADLAHLEDATRGLPGYERRRYVLLCLACAVLERSDPQITLRVLGERLLMLATDPSLAARDFTFTLQAQHERRELVAVCRSLLELGVLQRVAGDEEGFVRAESDVGGGAGASDALYDIQRRVLAGMLAAVRGPSTWSADAAPITLDERLHALVDEPRTDSDEARRNAIRHQLSRRLLDDPVLYADALDAETRAYFANQRGPMATRLCSAAGLSAEQRAEGLALVDEDGTLTDIAMPAEGTDAHVTLLVAELLASGYRNSRTQDVPVPVTTLAQVSAFVRRARERHGSHWRKSAREPGSEHELAAGALERLHKLQLIAGSADEVRPLPALARFAVGAPRIKKVVPAVPRDLFDSPSPAP